MVILHKAVEGVTQRGLARFVTRARTAAGAAGRVNVLLTSNRAIRSLNRSFRGQDKATDVLSFPALQAGGEELAGDIAISAEMAQANARRYGHSPAQEVKILVLHGILHLAGYDHERDRGEMAKREEHLRRALGLADGLIRRSLAGEGPAERPRPLGQRVSAGTRRR